MGRSSSSLFRNRDTRMKALVTGATGFIGSHLVESLLKKGLGVRCLVRETSSLKWIESYLPQDNISVSYGASGIELFYGDCLEKDSLGTAVSDVDYVFHVAGLTKAARNEDFYSVNVGGTKNVISAVIENNGGIKRFLFVSSLAASGPSSDGKALREDSEPHPVSYYGKSKLEAEGIVNHAGKTIPVTIIRPPAVYGPRDRDFYLFFKFIKRGIFPYWGKSFYSMVYIDDLINGIILAAKSEVAQGKTYFISDNEIHTNEEIAFEIADIFQKRLTKVRLHRAIMPILANIGKKFGKEGIVNRDKIRELSHACWICDAALAMRELDFKPSVSLKEGLKWTADWYRINRWL